MSAVRTVHRSSTTCSTLAGGTKRGLLHRRGTWMIAIIAATVAAVTAATVATRSTTSDTNGRPPALTAVVVNIDGQDIPVREFNIFLARERANTFAHYQQQLAVDGGTQFWTTPHDGETPQDYIKQLALADATRTVVQQQLAHRYGVLADPGYAAFVQAWIEENARRQKAFADHDVIYGPIQYTESNYFTYLFDQMVSNLKQTLDAQHVINTSDSLLYQFYLMHQAEFRQDVAGTDGMVAQSQEPISMATPAFAQIRAAVERAYIDDWYDTDVDKLVASAKVDIVRSVYDSIALS